MRNLRKLRQHLAGLVALALLALSLRHLSSGIGAITGSPTIESWLMATGIDLAMIAAEVAILCGVTTRWAHALIVSTLGLSAGFNVLAFSAHATGELGPILAVALGVFIPSAIYGLIQILGATVRRPSKARAVKASRKPQLRSVA